MTFQEAWDRLEATGRGFRVERLAPTTYLRDCVTASSPCRERADQTLGRATNGGSVYRCRVGRGRYVYGSTAAEAMCAALGLMPDKS